jgi:hypothetical protein
MLQAEDHLEFAQAEYYLLTWQLQEALQEEHEEEEEQQEEEGDVANDCGDSYAGTGAHHC